MTRVSRRVILAAALAAGTSGARARGDLTGMALELHAAAAANDAGAIRKLAAAGAPIEARDKAKRTALLIATRANVVEAAAPMSISPMVKASHPWPTPRVAATPI